MKLPTLDVVTPVPAGQSPDYTGNNPLYDLMQVYENVCLAAELEHYPHDRLQMLFPFESLEMYGPQSPNDQVLDPRQQDFVDFQKQNVKKFQLGDMHVVRGWVTVENWTGPFLRFSYRAGPDSALSKAAGGNLDQSIRLFAKVGANAVQQPILVPYNPRSDRYEVELWNCPFTDLRSKLDRNGKAAFDRGELIQAPELVHGNVDVFRRESVSDQPIPSVAPNHTMHPVNPLRIEMAWSDHTLTYWDSRQGQNHIYEFSMMVRGWDHFLKVGSSQNPHGGIGTLEYRNLLSNYFEFQNSEELGRIPNEWSRDVFGSKQHNGRREPSLAVDYMDLHIVRPNGGIGVHRHRDNQEIFMVLENEVVMIGGDWCEMPYRQRAFELRTLRAGHFALLKPGQLHGLMNPTDEDIPLLMFGGYD